MTLFSYGDASVILAGAAFLLAALAGVWLSHLVTVEVRRRGLAKVLLFVALSAPVAFWAGGKGGGDRSQGHDVVRDGQSESPLSGVLSQPRTIPGVTLRLPDSCDVGDGEGFFGLPCVSNLMIAAVVRGSNETASVVAWPYSARPLGDVVDFYAGTNLHALAKIFSLDVSACASNALVSVADEEVSGTNCNASAFFSVGDATDTDGDGLSDADERLLYKTNPAIVDTDGDGLDDGREVVLGTNPLAIDTDGDGLDDEEESGGLVVGRGDHTSNASYVVTNLTAALEANPDWCVNVEISPVTVLGEVYHRIAVDMNGLLYLRNDTTVDPARPYNGVVRSVRPSGAAYVVAPYWDRLSLSTNAPASSVTVGTWDEMPVVKFENMRVVDASDPESCLMSVKVVLPTTPFPFFGFIYEPMSVEVAGRAAGVGVRSPDGRFCSSDTICGLELDTGYNIVYVYPGYGTNPLAPDTDGDGLEDGLEVSVQTDPLQPDSDGDGMNDGWEYRHRAVGFNPGVDNATDDDLYNDIDADPDGDGLVNGQECVWGTNPSGQDENEDGIADGYDTDGDGVNDGFEISQNSDPGDADDDGKPDSRIPLALCFGDPSVSVSEKYRLEVLPVVGIGDTPRTFSWVNENYGRCETKTAMLKPGWKYEVRLWHAGTRPGYDDIPNPDYDYELDIMGSPPSNIVLRDPSALFGIYDASTFFEGEGKVAAITVHKVTGVTICKPDGSPWLALEESRVVLDNEPLRIKIEIEPKLDSLSQCRQMFGDSLTIKTLGTCPMGVSVPIGDEAEFVNEAAKSEVRVTKTRQQLKSFGLLPQNNEDGVNEMAWIDIVETEGQSTADSDAFSTLGYAFRGKATIDALYNLESVPPNSIPSVSFVKAAGSELITVTYGEKTSKRRQIMNQADVLYYSGHGSGTTGEISGGIVPSIIEESWKKDLNCVVIAGCSVLNIAGHRIKSFGMKTRFKRWVWSHQDKSVGTLWEGLSDIVFLGYCYAAPLDNQGAADIALDFSTKVKGGMGFLQAWKEANDRGSGRNACAIDCTTSPHQFWYWDETSGSPVWTRVDKGGSSW